MLPAYAHPPRVLVFDSGVGGLSIADAIKQQYPNIDITYCSDNAAFPYGTKSESTLISRTETVLRHIQNQVHANIIVIACNTASTVALPRLRASFKEPVIGVVPAIKPAAALSKSKVIGLLATPGTVSRAYTKDLVNEFANDCRVVSVGSAQLVAFAEDKLKGNAINLTAVKHSVQKFSLDTTIDTIVLACTHFPLLLEELKLVLPTIKHWVDSGDAIARRVGYWLTELNLSDTIECKNTYHSFFTENNHTIEQLRPALNRHGFGEIHFATLPFCED